MKTPGCNRPLRTLPFEQRGSFATHRGGRDQVGCTVLGRGENGQKIHDRLTIAAGVEGFRGFAMGRTSLWQPLLGFCVKKIMREAAVKDITCRYRVFVGIFKRAVLSKN